MESKFITAACRGITRERNTTNSMAAASITTIAYEHWQLSGWHVGEVDPDRGHADDQERCARTRTGDLLGRSEVMHKVLR